MKKICLVFILLFCTLNPALAEPVVPQSREQINLSFAPLVKRVTPAVVNIYTTRMVKQNLSPLFADPFFRQFFSIPEGMTRQRMENSLGSGVIVRGDGVIVTSNHVIQGADEIRVVLSDRREFDAKVIATDAGSDLAVLRIDARGDLPYLELRDSDEAQIGDLVLAIGNPFGVGQTVTSGIISAVAHRSLLGAGDINYFLQTDAAINPGNSGGALVTTDGKLIGINAAIYSRDGGNIGIGFAVPSNMVRVVINAVAEGKKTITRPWLGIGGQNITPDLAASMNIAEPSGVLVNEVHNSSPAGKAGLKVGDLITSVNGRSIEDGEAFRYRIATLPIGSDVTLGINRKGEKLTIATKPIAPPEDPPRDKSTITGRNPLSGATLQNLSPAVAEETGVRDADEGVIVTDIKDNSIAASINLHRNDIIVAINNAKPTSVAEVKDAIAKNQGRWRFSIKRGAKVFTILVGT